VGLGACCAVCGERRRDNLRLVELLRRSLPMCHNCGTRAVGLSPMPKTFEELTERLARERRQRERRVGAPDTRWFKRERRVADRRQADREHVVFLEDDFVIEVIEEPVEPALAEDATPRETEDATRIRSIADILGKTAG
jgi:hypothetical protein